MKVIEHLARAESDNKPIISIEIIPPKRGGNIHQIYNAIQSLLPFNPAYIDVTSHSAEVIWDEQPDGSYKRIVKRKSPGTFGLCAAIKYKFNIDPVPHILCAGFSREETEDAMIELNYLGVENMLLVRGDLKYEKPLREGRSVNQYAVNLVEQVNDMNQGRYLGELIDAQPTNFCIGVTAYPEKHFEAPNLGFDLRVLLHKQQAGAHYAVTQMFYDNNAYYNYVNKARELGITIPIIPGLKILTSKEHVLKLPKSFYLTLPEELANAVLEAKDNKAVQEIGIDWAFKQAMELLDFGVRNLHFFVMQNTSSFVRLLERLKKQI